MSLKGKEAPQKHNLNNHNKMKILPYNLEFHLQLKRWFQDQSPPKTFWLKLE